MKLEARMAASDVVRIVIGFGIFCSRAIVMEANIYSSNTNECEADIV
jgi:hypothetical protein